MKFRPVAPDRVVGLSCPARGTWIEIMSRPAIRSMIWSCPARGTWIEISSYGVEIEEAFSVVPRKGHVD